MAEPFIGEIRALGFHFNPRGWVFCNGQLLPIAQYSPLFAVIGVIYGGNGTTNFAVPNFQGVAPMGWGNGPGLTSRQIGETSGTPSVTLTAQEMPGHNHSANGLVPSNAPVQQSNTPTADAGLGTSLGAKLFAPPPATTTMAPQAIGQMGNSLPHENQQPLLALNFCIATEGIFPSRN
ncbi:MAG: hypothetical protein B7Y47_06065 [Sphingomonas sp. 28-63-12]|nr:MAG: hypothetical protein B7Y47_06065 [Sphingomonas sp. 28-63-12]